jgi:hypothetical protein
MNKFDVSYSQFSCLLKNIFARFTLTAFFFCSLPLSAFAQSETACPFPGKDNSLNFASIANSFENQSLIRPFQIQNQPVNPELIPDRAVYSLLFRVVSHRLFDAKKEISTRNYVKEKFKIGGQICTNCSNLEQSDAELDKDVNAFIASANEYKNRISRFDKLAAEIKFPNNKPDKSAATFAKLGNLQRQKETFIDEMIASLSARLSQKGKTKFEQSIQNELKSKVKIQSDSVSPSSENNFLKSANLLGKAQILPAKYNLNLIESASNDSSGYTDYSDVWLDATDPENPVMRGFGATEVAYTSAEDVADVTTELTMPDGTSISADGFGEFFALAEVSNFWGWIPGIFTLQTLHFPSCFQCGVCGYNRSMGYWLQDYHCPVCNSFLGSHRHSCGASRFTSVSFPISIKREVYVLIGDMPTGGEYGYGYCEYDNYCPFGLGVCGRSYFTVDRFNANAVCSGTIQCRTPYVRGTCYNIAKVCNGIPPNTGTCDYN